MTKDKIYTVTHKCSPGVYSFEYRTFYYDEDRNGLMDEDGIPVINPFIFMPTWFYRLAMARHEYSILEIHKGCFVEVIFPDEDEDYDDEVLFIEDYKTIRFY